MKNATITNTALMGILTGLAGIEHGIGEILQGSAAPVGLVIQSWPDSPVFEVVSGEPALTVIPNLLLSGILTILFSLIFIAWAVLGIRRKHGGLVLILICIPMLLCGAGFFPPVLGAIIGAAATRIHASSIGRRRRLPAGLIAFMARTWPFALAGALFTWLAMMPGTMLLKHFWGIYNTDLVAALLLGMILFLFMAILTASAHDDQRAATAG